MLKEAVSLTGPRQVNARFPRQGSVTVDYRQLGRPNDISVPLYHKTTGSEYWKMPSFYIYSLEPPISLVVSPCNAGIPEIQTGHGADFSRCVHALRIEVADHRCGVEEP